MSVFVMVTWYTLSEHQLFTLILVFKLFHFPIAIANIRSLKAGEIWTKLDDPNYTNFRAFWQKAVYMLTISDIIVGAIF